MTPFKLLRALNQYADMVGPDNSTCRTVAVFTSVKVFERLLKNALIDLQFVAALSENPHAARSYRDKVFSRDATGENSSGGAQTVPCTHR